MAAQDKQQYNYNEDKQILFLKFLLSNEEVYVRCQNILSPDLFDVSLKNVVKFVKDYTNDYKVIPTPDQIKSETGMMLEKIEDAIVKNPNHIEWFLDAFPEFCRHRALQSAIYKADALLAEGKYGDVEQSVKDALLISLHKDLGTDYWHDPRTRLEKLYNNDAKIPTGWKAIDKVLYGGFDKGGLFVFAAPSGMGKSIFLQNMTRNWSNMGLNVVYISLELSEELISQRLDAMEMGMPTKEILGNIEKVELALKFRSKKAGARQIVQLPQGSTVNDIRAYLKEYEIKYGIKPDAIMVDYLDLLYPNAKNINLGDAFTKDKLVSEELRGLGSDLNIPVVTASQLNRDFTKAATESHGKPTFDHSHIAGGISKINTADVVMGLFKSGSDDNWIYRVSFMKTRSSSGTNSTVFLGYNAATMVVHDTDYVEEDDFDDSSNNVIRKTTDINDIVNTLKNKRSSISDRLNGDKSTSDDADALRKKMAELGRS